MQCAARCVLVSNHSEETKAFEFTEAVLLINLFSLAACLHIIANDGFKLVSPLRIGKLPFKSIIGVFLCIFVDVMYLFFSPPNISLKLFLFNCIIF